MTFREQLSRREGEILHLLAEGAADKEIAAELHLSLNTVKWHNRQLYTKLGVTNRTQAVKTAEKRGLLGESVEQEKPISRIPNNLPAPVSSFVGRKDEIVEIMDLLQHHRLVTLTGPGGVGKTRLALEVASSLLAGGQFQDGIYFVELAPISDPARVGEAVLEVIGLKLEVGQTAQEKLMLFLIEKHLLLLLDNFEHLLEGAPLVAALLQESPDLQVLATSREVLHLSGEQTYFVPPLEINPSRELFIQRAREINPGFDPAPAELPIIGRICDRLDRLPLAIELAVARLPLFSLHALLQNLEDRFQVLTAGNLDAPDRHRTLWDAIDWSYQLLSEEEQTLFRRLAVFQGSRTIDAVQDICCFDLELSALDGLASLLAKNLIRQEIGLDGETRFYLLETLHEYAREQLQESGEEEAFRRRHAEYFVNLAERSRIPRLLGPENFAWRKKLAADFENLRLAHDWTFSRGDDVLRLRLVYGLIYFWGIMGHCQEARAWVDSALEIVDRAPPALQAGVYWAASQVDSIGTHYDHALELCREALMRFQALEDQFYLGQCHLSMIYYLNRRSDIDEEAILEHFRTSERIFSEIGSRCGLADAYVSLAEFYDVTGREIEACQEYEKALQLSREIGDEGDAWRCLINLAVFELARGNTKLAREMYLEILEGEYLHFKNQVNIEGTFESLAGPELALGRPRRALILLSTANAIARSKGGVGNTPYHHMMVQNYLDQCAAQLSQAAFTESWDQGQAMSFEEAVAFAREDIDQTD